MDGIHDRIEFRGTQFPVSIIKNKVCRAGQTLPELGMSWHEETELKYICSGCLTVSIEGETLQASQGDIVIINPYEGHCTVGGNTGAEYHLILFRSEILFKNMQGEDELEYYRLFTEGRLHFPHLIGNDRVGEIIRKIAEAEAKSYGVLARIGLLYCLFSELFSVSSLTVTEERTIDNLKKKGKIEPALNYIKEHLGEKLDLNKLASVCYLDKFYFSKLFKSAMRISPHMYVNKLRLNYAAELLSATDFPMAEIARKTGFSDEFYFGKWFKKNNGVPPGKYRTRKNK